MLVVATLATLAVAFTGCYSVHPAPKGDVYGTYELTTYTRTYPVKDGEDEPEVINFVEDYGAKSYIVVGEDGFGYYFYSDKETELFGKEIKITLEETTNEEKAGRIAYVCYDVDGEKGDRFGVNQKTFGQIILNYTGKPTGFRFAKENDRIVAKKAYSETVKYKKISGITSLKTVSKKLPMIPLIAPYELNAYDGKLLGLRISDFERKQCPLVYFACRIDADHMNAEVRYGLKGEGAEVLDRQASDVKVELVEMNGEFIGIKVGDYSFIKGYSNLMYTEGDKSYGLLLSYDYDEETLDDYISSEKQYYSNTIAAENQQ